jgi:hypothetical protein
MGQSSSSMTQAQSVEAELKELALKYATLKATRDLSVKKYGTSKQEAYDDMMNDLGDAQINVARGATSTITSIGLAKKAYKSKRTADMMNPSSSEDSIDCARKKASKSRTPCSPDCDIASPPPSITLLENRGSSSSNKRSPIKSDHGGGGAGVDTESTEFSEDETFVPDTDREFTDQEEEDGDGGTGVDTESREDEGADDVLTFQHAGKLTIHEDAETSSKDQDNLSLRAQLEESRKEVDQLRLDLKVAKDSAKEAAELDESRKEADRLGVKNGRVKLRHQHKRKAVTQTVDQDPEVALATNFRSQFHKEPESSSSPPTEDHSARDLFQAQTNRLGFTWTMLPPSSASDNNSE